jgi:hypothetical protein
MAMQDRIAHSSVKKGIAMKGSLFVAALLTGLISLSGCAYGNRYHYADARATPHYAGNGAIAAATYDQRPYVLSGNKTPDFVGLQRGRFGIPFDVHTDKGQPLAEDFVQVMVASLKGVGYQARPVPTAATDKLPAVKSRLLQSKPRRALLLTINEWKSDTSKNVALYYDLSLSVSAADGSLLAQKSLKGRDDLGGQFFGSGKYAKVAVSDAFGLKLQALLDEPEIARALK